MRDAVEGDLVGKCRNRKLIATFAVEIFARLVVKLGHRRRAGTAGGLIRRDDHALDRRNVMQRFQR